MDVFRGLNFARSLRAGRSFRFDLGCLARQRLFDRLVELLQDAGVEGSALLRRLAQSQGDARHQTRFQSCLHQRLFQSIEGPLCSTFFFHLRERRHSSLQARLVLLQRYGRGVALLLLGGSRLQRLERGLEFCRLLLARRGRGLLSLLGGRELLLTLLHGGLALGLLSICVLQECRGLRCVLLQAGARGSQHLLHHGERLILERVPLLLVDRQTVLCEGCNQVADL
mmetsp:Transcript_45162/g.84291  ORF Transcript_45162/g.84291 Transcript_45162/m.84291 type:complete len:226 (+) Transcript_45162:402-1079(+)